MGLRREEVIHIADLAHLELSEAEIERFQEQLSAILDYAARIQALNTEAIPPTASVLPLTTVLREDEVQPSMPREEALRNAPESLQDCFAIPPLR